MNPFKELEKDTPELPLGIKSNVQEQLKSMRTMGDVLELYLSRVLDMFTAMFGGETNKEGKTHLVTLFVPTTVQQLEETVFIKNLSASFSLQSSPVLVAVAPVEKGVEVSLKMTGKDATQFRKKANVPLLADLQLEVR